MDAAVKGEEVEIIVSSGDTKYRIVVPWCEGIELDEYWFKVLRPAFMCLRNFANESR